MGHDPAHRARAHRSDEGPRLPLFQGRRSGPGGLAPQGGQEGHAGRFHDRAGAGDGPRWRRAGAACPRCASARPGRSGSQAARGVPGLRGPRGRRGRPPPPRRGGPGAWWRIAEPDRRRCDRGGGGVPGGRLAGGRPYRQAPGARRLARPVRRRPARPRAPRAADRRLTAPGAARPVRPAGTSRDRGAARGPGRAALAGAAAMTAASFAQALDQITRVPGVRGAMLVAGDDGLVVAEHLMEGIRGPAVAALAASLATRLRRAMEAAGAGTGQFWQLLCEGGGLLVVPGASGGLLIVAITAPDVNAGLVRLELLRAAEAVA